MLLLRAPLFSVSLAFASGCILGFDGWISLSLAVALCLVTGLAWLFLARHDNGSLAACYLFAASAGLAHVLLLDASIPSEDLRRLPVEKTYASTQWRGLIIEEPVSQLSARITRRSLDRASFVLRVEAWHPTGGRLFGADIDEPWQPAQGDIRCTLANPSQDLRSGDRLEFAAALQPISAPLSPGQFDRRAWEARQGIYYDASVSTQDWKCIATGGGNWWQQLAFRARDWAYGRLQLGLEDDPRTANFLAGMLIGYRQQIPTDIQDDFRRTGTLHVFAVSGQNIAEVVLVSLILLQLCGFVPWRWAWTVAPLVLLYCLLTGAPASAVRATVMALTVLLAWRLGRPLNALACWSLAFLAMLIWNPVALLDPGAQLSFGVVLGLILIAPPLMRLFLRPVSPDPFLPHDLLTTAQKLEKRGWQGFCLLLASSIAAALVSEPITAIAFHQVTPISVFANLVVVPIAGFITIIGTISVTASLFSTGLAILFNNANWLLARVIILFVGFLSHEPGASVNVPDLRALSSPQPSLVVVPAQGSASLLVRTAQGDWLFNAGRETPSPSSVWRLLQFYGINRLEGLVLTQISAPDNGGVARFLQDFHPHRLVVPALDSRSPLTKELPDLAAATGRKLERWQRGQSLTLAPDLTVQVLHPTSTGSGNKADDRSLVLLFHLAGQTLLWAGHAGVSTQIQLLQEYPDLHADVLVMSTDPPPDEAWLRSLHPRHWLQIPSRFSELNLSGTLAPSESRLWPLDQTGAVEIHFQPGHIFLRPWLALPVAEK